MWRMDHGLRSAPGADAASGAIPIKSARPTSPVARGPVNTPTADARKAPSLTTWSATRNSASSERVGATPWNGVSRATPIECATTPASGTPSVSPRGADRRPRSEEHTSELQSRLHLVCRLLLEKKKTDQETLEQ